MSFKVKKLKLDPTGEVETNIIVNKSFTKYVYLKFGPPEELGSDHIKIGDKDIYVLASRYGIEKSDDYPSLVFYIAVGDNVNVKKLKTYVMDWLNNNIGLIRSIVSDKSKYIETGSAYIIMVSILKGILTDYKDYNESIYDFEG